jgi:hypothetical protein
MNTDRAERPTGRRAPDVGRAVAEGVAERASGPPVQSDKPEPLYAVVTRKTSGEWRTFDTFICPRIANEVCAILRSFGADCKIDLIEQPIP